MAPKSTHSGRGTILCPLPLLTFTLLLLLVAQGNAQFFSSNPIDSGSSRWSISIESSVGFSGVFPDSIGNSSTLEDEEESDPFTPLIPIIFPANALFSYEGSAGIHYRVNERVRLGFIAGYETRGTTDLTISTDHGEFDRILIGYLALGPRVTIGSSKLIGSIGLTYGIPLSVTASNWFTSTDEIMYDITSSDGVTIPPAIMVDIRLMYPFLRLNNHTLSAGAIWNATFTNLVGRTETPNLLQGKTGSSLALRLGINWSFGL